MGSTVIKKKDACTHTYNSAWSRVPISLAHWFNLLLPISRAEGAYIAGVCPVALMQFTDDAITIATDMRASLKWKWRQWLLCMIKILNTFISQLPCTLKALSLYTTQKLKKKGPWRKCYRAPLSLVPDSLWTWFYRKHHINAGLWNTCYTRKAAQLIHAVKWKSW